MKIKVPHFIYAAFCALGLFVFAYAAWHWFALNTGSMEGTAYCDISATCSCEEVTSSQYGDIANIPIGIFGLLYVFLLLLLGFTKGVPKRALNLMFVPGYLVCGFLAYILAFVLEGCCINCYLGYVSLFGAGITSFFMKPAEVLKPLHAGLALLVGVLLAAGYTAAQNQPHIPESADLDKFRAFFAQMERESIPDLSPFKDDVANPEVVIHEFADFSCPACAFFYDEVLSRVKRMPGVQLVFQPNPIDPSCYPNYEGEPVDPSLRCSWVKASFCAHDQGVFWEVHDFLMRDYTLQGATLPFVDQPTIESLGMDWQSFDQCFKSEETQKRVDAVLNVSLQMNIEATPTFFVNGRRYKGRRNFDQLWQIVKEARKMDGGSSNFSTPLDSTDGE